MKILHLNSNFLYSNLYQNQLNNMSHTFQHVIYNPIKKSNKSIVRSNYKIYDPLIINRLDSVLTINRLRKSRNYILNNMDLYKVAGVHAHTLSNDGLLAFDIFKNYKVPYIVTIRNTDVNYTLKYKLHMKKLYGKVLTNAKTIIFPNKVYQNKLLNYFNDKTLKDEIRNKSIFIPNGIDDFWIKNKSMTLKAIDKGHSINLLFVGRIYKNKNIHSILEAMKESNYKLNLTVIGNVIDKKYFKYIENNYDFTYLGVQSKERIKEIMKDMDIFIMPSFNETFGLVYIEALSQNLPIVYTKNEGIDQFFSDKQFGRSVTPNSAKDISKSIDYIIDNYNEIQLRLTDKEFLDKFDWKNIGEIYNNLYVRDFKE